MIGAVASASKGRDIFKVFRTPLPDVLSGDPADAPPKDPDSDGIVARLKWELPRLTDPNIPITFSDGSTTPRGAPSMGPKLGPRIPIYRAGALSQPVPQDRDDGDSTRNQLTQLSGVSIPRGAMVSQPGTSDNLLCVWSPDEDKMWEGFKWTGGNNLSAGNANVIPDMTFSPWGSSSVFGLSAQSVVANGSLTVGKAYFYIVTAVTAAGETGINTDPPTGLPGKVAVVIPAGSNKTGRLNINPRFLIDSINVWRAETTVGSTFPPSPPDGAAHRLTVAQAGHRANTVYYYNAGTSAWVPIGPLGTELTYPIGPLFHYIDTITPDGAGGTTAKPTLFGPTGVVTAYDDTGANPPDLARTVPSVSTAVIAANKWRCYLLGTMLNASASPGHWQELSSGPGSPQARRGWGCTATGVPAMAGQITKRDFDRGVIDHLMTWSIQSGSSSNSNAHTPPAGGWTDATRHAYPAQARDPGEPRAPTSQMLAAGCPSNALAIPEGARFRLPADFDLASIETSAAFAALTAIRKKLCRMFARALKEYGIITTDGSNGINIHCGWPYIEDPIASPNIADNGQNGTNGSWRPGWADEYAALKPRLGANGTLTGQGGGGPFPWDAVEVVRMGWGPGWRGDPNTLTACANVALPCPVGGQ